MTIVNSLQHLRDAVPLIVTGVARSGTRMVSDVLSFSDHILLEKEMHLRSFEAILKMFEDVDHNFEHYSILKNQTLDGGYKHAKSTLFKATLNTVSKGPPASLNKLLNNHEGVIKYYGIKTPGFERYFSSFEKLFAPQSPLYIYCIRNVESVWRSWLAREFLTDVNVFLSRYKRSLRQVLKIKKTCPERLAIFNLDEFISKDENSKGDYFTDVVFNQLGIEPFQWPEEGFKNTNSAAGNGFQLPTVSSEDLDVIRNDSVLSALREQLLH